MRRNTSVWQVEDTKMATRDQFEHAHCKRSYTRPLHRSGQTGTNLFDRF